MHVALIFQSLVISDLFGPPLHGNETRAVSLVGNNTAVFSLKISIYWLHNLWASLLLSPLKVDKTRTAILVGYFSWPSVKIRFLSDTPFGQLCFSFLCRWTRPAPPFLSDSSWSNHGRLLLKIRFPCHATPEHLSFSLFCRWTRPASAFLSAPVWAGSLSSRTGCRR